MKILFIDIDGVLNYHNSSRLADSCLAEAKRIAEATDSKFVLTSDWREAVLFPERCSMLEIAFVDRLMRYSDLPFIGVTPYIDYEQRELEIQAWMHERQVENFAILDDLDFKPQETFPGHFVKTSGFFKSGLTKENADEIIRILNT